MKGKEGRADVMPDSNITKNALAASLKQLMSAQPINKISVGDICENCGMNRKSFYYHFKDKYDLVNWIFDTEFVDKVSHKKSEGSKELFLDVCEYFYSERDFYRNALNMTGQNSFKDYFRTRIYPILKEMTSGIIETDEDSDFMVVFLTDALISSLIRWLNESKNQIPPKEFSDRINRTILAISKAVIEKYNEATPAS